MHLDDLVATGPYNLIIADREEEVVPWRHFPLESFRPEFTSNHGLRLPVCGSTFKHNSIWMEEGNSGRHFESAAMNGTCISISPEFLPLLMDKDLLQNIFESLHEIKQELDAKRFQVNDIRENLPPHAENARRKPDT